MALTLFAIQNAKPKEKPYKLSDGEGLHLLVQPNGSKLWRFRYQFALKEKMLSLGTFPEVSLASARTKRNEAHRLRGTIGSVYRFAIANLKVENDPTYPLRGALLQPNVRHRPGIIDEVRLGELLRSIDAYEGRSPVVRAALQFEALTFCRPVEARLMRKSEVNWLKTTWVIPAERMKMRRPFQVWLSRQALEILRSVWEMPSELVFPSMYSLRKPMSDNTLNSALRKMGYSGNEHVAHGFRTSASTILNERGYSPDVIEVALAHQDEDEVRRAYNRAEYWPERMKMLQDWADLLDQFRQQAAARNVA
jgi:integrase